MPNFCVKCGTAMAPGSAFCGSCGAASDGSTSAPVLQSMPVLKTLNPNDVIVRCPKCGSNQIHAEKRGFTLTTGFIGSRRVYITCIACGKRFSPGEGLAWENEKNQVEADSRLAQAREVIRLRENARVSALSDEELDEIERIATFRSPKNARGVTCSPEELAEIERVATLSREEVEVEVQQNLIILRKNEKVQNRKVAITFAVTLVVLVLLVLMVKACN